MLLILQDDSTHIIIEVEHNVEWGQLPLGSILEWVFSRIVVSLGAKLLGYKQRGGEGRGGEGRGGREIDTV